MKIDIIQIYSLGEHMNLDKQNIKDIFKKIDDVLIKKNISVNLIIIGGAVVAYLDMPERVTIDIDFFGNSEENKAIFKDIATELNIDFDPSDYQFSDKPYLQWVNPNFVHMPKDDIWKKDIQSMWDGEKLHVYHPPIGIILCSKLAAAREKDIVDVKYLSDKYPKWEKSIEKYINLFSIEDQQEINDNKIFIDLYVTSQKKQQNISVQNPKLHSRKIK